MDYIHALILGIVEGLTEFLPVSSTGHLILFRDMLGLRTPPGQVFEIVIQLGAILAICYKYRQKLFGVLITAHKNTSSQKFLVNIALAFFPAALIGVFAHDYIKEELFLPEVVAIALIIGGIAIILIESLVKRVRFRGIEEINWKTALKIGLFQSVAMIPGVSRSGATIMGSLLVGLERKAATEFSFFLAIPTMLGATVFDLYKNWGLLSVDSFLVIAVGFVMAFIAALFVVDVAIRFISTHGFKPFAYYRILLGVVILALLEWS